MFDKAERAFLMMFCLNSCTWTQRCVMVAWISSFVGEFHEAGIGDYMCDWWNF
jgi:hypothetical protein